MVKCKEGKVLVLQYNDGLKSVSFYHEQVNTTAWTLPAFFQRMPKLALLLLRAFNLVGAITWCKIMGLLAKSTSGFGTLSVSGRRRVPKPPTRIKAFIFGTGMCSRSELFVI